MKEKVVGFAKEHWDDLATLGIVAVAEIGIYRLYKAYLDKCLAKLDD